MTPRQPRGVILTCPTCGYTTRPTTAGQAERSLRIHRCDLQLAHAARAARVAERRQADGPLRRCMHPGDPHAHGTHAAYSLDRCRCRPCRDATAAYNATRSRRLAYGTWQPYIDAGPAREHVRALQAAGMGARRIAELAGITPSVMSKLLYGVGTQPPTRRLRPANAAAILAVRPDLAGGAVVDATGTRRRLQALTACGWSGQQLAKRLGMERGNYTTLLRRATVRGTTAAAVRELYDELWNVAPDASTPHARGGISRALNTARRNGWAPPLAWDEDTIDDPTARPADLTPTRRRGGGRSRLDVAEDVAWLVDDDQGTAAICARLDLRKDSLHKALRAAGRGDLLDRLAIIDGAEHKIRKRVPA